MASARENLLRGLNTPKLSVLNEESHGDERSALLGKITEYLVVCVFIVTLIMFEWAHWVFKWRPQPVIFSFMGICLIGYAAVRVWIIIPRLRALRSEKEAALYLRAAIQSLGAHGWYVFDHIVDAEGRFIGGVIVGPGGVFSLTTRFVSRGSNSDTIDHLDRQTIHAGGHEILGDPLGQARRAAFLLYTVLEKENLDTLPVQAVLIFPGWRVGKMPAPEERDVLAGSELLLEEELAKKAPVLEPRQVIQACTALEKYTRAKPVR